MKMIASSSGHRYLFLKKKMFITLTCRQHLLQTKHLVQPSQQPFRVIPTVSFVIDKEIKVTSI